MENEIPQSLVNLTKEKISALEEAAWEAEKNNENAQAVKFYKEAANLSKEINLINKVVFCLRKAGHLLSIDNQLKEALSTFYEALAYSDQLNSNDLVRIVIGIADVGRYIPSTLDSIKKTQLKASEIAKQKGNHGWKAEIAFFNGKLANLRGEPQSSIDHLTEAISLYNMDPGFTCQTGYYDELIYSYLIAGKKDMAKIYIDKLELLKSSFEKTKKVLILNNKIRLNLMTSNFEIALKLSRLSDLSWTKINGFLSVQEVFHIKDSVLEYLKKYRNSESYLLKLGSIYIWGDVYSTIIRKNLLLPFASISWSDDELLNEHKFESKKSDANLIVNNRNKEFSIELKNLYKWFRNARKAYFYALDFSQEVDKKLDTNYNAERAERRLNLLYNLYKSCSGKLTKKEFMNESSIRNTFG